MFSFLKTRILFIFIQFIYNLLPATIILQDYTPRVMLQNLSLLREDSNWFLFMSLLLL